MLLNILWFTEDYPVQNVKNAEAEVVQRVINFKGLHIKCTCYKFKGNQ